ncbi:MAG: ribonuclease HII [Nanoarchaeota archaeon]
MVLICAIDEAGRGPVIGPMVMAGILVDEKDLSKLRYIGVKDSKELTPKQREFLFKEITKIVKDYRILIIPPKEIDDALNSQELNLNRLEAIKIALIINKLKPDKVIFDCPSTNPKNYINYLRLFLKDKELEIDAGHKYDTKFVEVGAASVLAKVTRDLQIKKIQTHIKENIGSGYASDPYTIKFLKENYKNYPEIIRKTWSTYKRINNQKNLDEF